MSDKIALLFGVHAHQPAGNFVEVVERAHERCYRPFLQTVAAYPAFRFAAHFSGPLLDQLAGRFPEDIALLQQMAARGQVEMVGAGDTEPVLAAIPHRDRIHQIERLSAKLAMRFGSRPRGAWLTERVWESAVVPALAECGIRYAVVDDYHFLCTGKTSDELDSYFTTEEDGWTLDLFPISEELRYRIPFAPAAEAIRHIENLRRDGVRRAVVYFDDIEKFGIWPETYAWVYERGWLREFVERALASPAIEVTTYADYHTTGRTRGIVYLPTTSYIEMNEWSLPARAAAEYAALIAGEKKAGRFPARKGFLRGGIWRNFLSRYPEANWMHKRMLALSARLAAQPESGDTEPMRSLLHLAQANDAYWHGLFGGLYLPHLRRSVYRHLLELEARLDRIAPRAALERVDLDHDGSEELFLHDEALQIVLRLDGSGALREFDSYALAQNFGDTLPRHAEHYHVRARAGAGTAHQGEGIVSAHDRVSFKHDIAAHELDADPSGRDMFRDAWVDAAGHPEVISAYALLEPMAHDRTIRLHVESSGRAVITKHIRLDVNGVSVQYRVTTVQEGGLRVGLDLAMPSCDGYSGRYIVDGAIPGGFGQPLDLDQAGEFTLDDRFMRGAVVIRCSPPARVTGRPYHTVSQSEEGFERIMQTVTLELAWPVSIGASEFEIELRVRPDA